MQTKVKRIPKINPDKAAAELCKRSFFFFVQEFWDTIIAEEPVWNWHIKYLCSELQIVAEKVINREAKEYDLIVNVPPGTSKSTIATIMLPAWCWARAPWIRAITGSYSDALSTEHAVKSRDIIKSDKYRKYFPEIQLKQDKDNKTNYENTLKGQRFATSVGGTITGVHGHIIIIDDPLNPKKAASQGECINANSWMDQTLSTRKVDKKSTPTILIMQRLATNDCTGHWLDKKNKVLKHICLPAEDSDNVKPADLRAHYVNGLLDPVRLSSEVLMESKIDLGTSGYAGQMSQTPVPAGGMILKRDWFEIVDRPIPSTVVRKFQIDTAYTEDQENDPSAVVPYYKEGDTIYITNAESVWLGFPQFIKYLTSFVQNNGYSWSSIIRVEPKATGKSVIQQIRDETDLNIVESIPPREDKRTMVNTVSPKIEAGRVKLHRGSWNEEFINQVCSFPKAPHDEYIDILVGIIIHELINDEDTWGMERVN